MRTRGSGTHSKTGGLAFHVVEQASFNFAQGNRQWLFALHWGYQWADELEYPWLLLLVEAVDLASTLGGKDYQSIFGGYLLEQLVNWGRGDTYWRIKYLFVFCDYISHVACQHLFT